MGWHSACKGKRGRCFGKSEPNYVIVPLPMRNRAPREILLALHPDAEGPEWFEAVRDTLNSSGLTALSFFSGPEAIQRIEAGGLAAAVLFGDLVHIDGLSLLRIIRSIDSILPCWLVTADTSRRTLQTAFELRVAGVVPHPVEPRSFSLRLTRALVGAGPKSGDLGFESPDSDLRSTVG